MGKLAAQVLSDRAARDAARAVFNAHYGALKADFEERGLGGRVVDEAIDGAKDVFDEAVAVAEEHPGAISGTIVVLALWFMRNPIVAWLERTLGPVITQIKG